MRTEPTTNEAPALPPLGRKVEQTKDAAPNGGWVRIGRREAYDVWKHADGRLATTPPGHTPDVKLMPKEKQA